MNPSRCFALILGAGLLLTAPILAAPGTKVPPPDPQFAAAVNELHVIIKVLEGADHDYDGHRVAAIHAVHKAIHALHPHHKLPQAPTKPAVKAPPVKVPPMTEPQAVSDMQLAAALTAIQKVQTNLAGSSKPAEQKALVELALAVTELNVALKIK